MCTTHPAEIRLFGEYFQLGLAGRDGEVGLWNLEDLGVGHLAVIGAVTEGLCLW